MLKAGDVMQTHVVTVPPELGVLDLEQKLAHAGVSGMPVVTGDKVVGVVSRADIVRSVATTEASAAATLAYYEDVGGARPEPAAAARMASERLANAKVADIMSREVVSVSPTTPVREVAQTLSGRNLHRVLVTDGGRLVGLVTTLDLVRAIADDRLH